MTQDIINKPVVVNEFFKNKGIDWNCLICGHGTRLVPNEDTAIMIRRKNIIISDFFPIQIIQCAKCGFIHLFNARVLGVINNDDKKNMIPVQIN